ncbi:unnamed protein product [Cutaneotrichosporon oleaginosum]
MQIRSPEDGDPRSMCCVWARASLDPKFQDPEADGEASIGLQPSVSGEIRSGEEEGGAREMRATMGLDSVRCGMHDGGEGKVHVFLFQGGTESHREGSMIKRIRN